MTVLKHDEFPLMQLNLDEICLSSFGYESSIDIFRDLQVQIQIFTWFTSFYFHSPIFFDCDSFLP